MNCLHCTAPTTNGLALCDMCQRKAETCLTYLPVYFRNLARWRPGRAGSRPVPGSRVLYDGTVRGAGTGDKISDTLDEALTALTTWARALVADRTFARPLTFANAVLSDDLSDEVAEALVDDRALAVTWLCVGLEHHLTSVATLEWCGEFVRDLGGHETRLRALTETMVPGWYAGLCGRQLSKETKCDAPTYVVPGLTWVTCRACGSTTYARDHLETVLTEAREWIARPKALAEAVVALVDTEQSVPRLYTRIRQWAHQGDIESIRRTTRDYEYIAETKQFVVVDSETGPARYRMGEVLDRVLVRDTRGGNDAKVS